MHGAISGAISGTKTSRYCFVAGTAVLTESGLMAIEDIKAGDTVWAALPETGQKELKKVVRTFENETSELVHVKVEGEVISATPSHPFYSPVKGWTNASDLRAGDVLVLQNGNYVIIEEVQHEILESPVKVYNFEVEDFHTYYVGENSVLTHNKCKNSKKAKKAQKVDNGPKYAKYYKTRKQAFRAAKRDAGIPRSAQPSKVTGAFERDGKTRLPGRDYYYSGKKILNHTAGHTHADTGTKMGRHFNYKKMHYFY